MGHVMTNDLIVNLVNSDPNHLKRLELVAEQRNVYTVAYGEKHQEILNLDAIVHSGHTE